MLLVKERSFTPVGVRTTTIKPYSVVGGMFDLLDQRYSSLSPLGFAYDPAAAVSLLFDSPVGFALHTLQTLTIQPQCLIIVTQNQCPEYWDDLWDFHPCVMLLEKELEYLERAFGLAQRADRHRTVPSATTHLTLMERRVLRILACGHSNPEIANMVSVQHKTIRNVLTTIYEKLGVRNRTDALLYYWGTWQGYARVARAAEADAGGCGHAEFALGNGISSDPFYSFAKPYAQSDS